MLQAHIVPALLFVVLCSTCCLTAKPRRLQRCPSDFETVVEPLPDSVGDPVLIADSGVRLRTVEFLQDTVLREETGRLLLNKSVNVTQGPYNGPHVILCSDPDQPLVTFSLFFKITNESTETDTAAPQDPTVIPRDQLTTAATVQPSVNGLRPTDSSSHHEANDPLLLTLAISVILLFLLSVCLGAALIGFRCREINTGQPRAPALAGYRDELLNQLLKQEPSLTSLPAELV